MFNKLLIANRGEIACRIIHTAKRLGISTVAVYSEADANARHKQLADEAVAIGPAPARDSYLAGEKLIRAATGAGAEALHPGYGFLSENAGFAAACKDAGITFIGPSPRAIEAMGCKSAAKTIMQQAGIPLVPGYHGDNQDQTFLLGEAEKIGFPVMLKAAAGGGGRGMRVVRRAPEFSAALHSARREARGAFNDEKMLLEKYLEQPRHIEIQIFCDEHGNALHLFERDCSIQRRHQKVLEEAPVPGMTEATRSAMGAAAISAARAIDYTGAGTVEFIVDTDGRFYFMEMNTRLQVEHPVTELITGLDLVAWQLQVAAGEPLPASQQQLTSNGHALEARIYAEDPQHGFLPATGTLNHLRFPGETPQVRIDTGVRQGDTISVYYDPLIAKLIVHGSDRSECLRRMAQALSSVRVAGVTTNIDFLGAIVSHEAFRAAKLDTGFIERHLADLIPAQSPAAPELLALAALYRLLRRVACAQQQALSSGDPTSPWWATDGWRPNLVEAAYFTFHDGLQAHEVRVTATNGGQQQPRHAYLIRTGQRTLHATGSLAADGALIATLDTTKRQVHIVEDQEQLIIFTAGNTQRLQQLTDYSQTTAEQATGNLTAPMPGAIIEVMVSPGQQVSKGDTLLVLEAMKIEHTISAPDDGTVQALHYQAGDMVEEGVELLRLAAGRREQ
ncbi:MAG: acetyl/propionyl/methylcrotonyl-CoA carboxylase subunit alpha [Gammaproteobacteria bacterium]|nr:acetyl/propionyl/methylcrotonyl-CoA carboxylase subunit alpha [Gammaproteobacteria bacterium]